MKSSANNSNLRGIEHIGITVPDHAEAIAFFKEAFGVEVLFSLASKSGPPITAEEVGNKNGLQKGTAIAAVSMLRFGNGANLEIFEIDHPLGQTNSGISSIGISHFSVTVEDIELATTDFVRAGGSLLEGPYDLTLQEEGPGNMGCFGLTPWGLLIEFEQLPSPMQYDDSPRSDRWLPDPICEKGEKT